MSVNAKDFVEIESTPGHWERVSVKDAVGTTNPVRCPECHQPGKVQGADMVEALEAWEATT